MSAKKILISEVLGNSQKLDGGCLFGNAPRAVWSKWAPPDEMGRIDLACRALLVEIDNIKILFEAGIGCFFEPKMAERFGVQDPSRHHLIENLKKLKIHPEEIDWVILSHLHFDHAGGILPSYTEIQKGNNGLAFPKARYVVGKEAFARAENPHFRDKASFIPGLTEKLKATQKLHLIEQGGPSPIFPEIIQFIFSFGHTPGHMHSLIKGNREPLFFAGDLIPGIPWLHLPITMGYDRFPEKVIDEKQDIYTQALKENWNLYYTHDTHVAYSKLIQDEKSNFKPTFEVQHPVRIEI